MATTGATGPIHRFFPAIVTIFTRILSLFWGVFFECVFFFLWWFCLKSLKIFKFSNLSQGGRIEKQEKKPPRVGSLSCLVFFSSKFHAERFFRLQKWGVEWRVRGSSDECCGGFAKEEKKGGRRRGRGVGREEARVFNFCLVCVIFGKGFSEEKKNKTRKKKKKKKKTESDL